MFGHFTAKSAFILSHFSACRPSREGSPWAGTRARRPAVDALVGVDHQHVLALVEAVDGADLDAVHVLALDAVFGDDVGHALIIALRAPLSPCHGCGNKQFPAGSDRLVGQAAGGRRFLGAVVRAVPCAHAGAGKLEREYAGRFKLVKVNVDENQELAEALQVRSIPAVFAFRDGKPLGHFLGALPESQVRAFIERALPSPFIEVMDRAERLIQEGGVDAAAKLLAEVPPNIDWDTRLEALRAAVSFARSGERRRAEGEARCQSGRPRGAAQAGAAPCRRSALPRGHGPAARDRTKRQELARRRGAQAAAHAFHSGGGEPELVSEYRRKLASALY